MYHAGDNAILGGNVRRTVNDRVLPDSTTHVYTKSELSGLNDAELCIAWNELFALNGYNFKNFDLQNYFDGTSWYVNTGGSGELSSLSSIERKNFHTLQDLLSDGRWTNLAQDDFN